jgi:serine/threonine-protein kinase
MAATDDLAPRSSPPQRIGRYQIKARIGRGAMGVVYQAWDELMCRDVALKVLTADLEDDPEIRTRFLREGQAAAALFHPNIITIFDVGEDGARFFIVMELLRGVVLKEFLKQPDAAGLARKLHLMMQLCAGLSAAHRASICHRDIKPGNIFVRSDGLLKILDFGVARFASSGITTSGFVVGTPDYMSPEQARGEEIDNRSDIFSMGGVFYFMLTGRKPFASTMLPTLFQQIQSENPAPIDDDTPPDLAAVVMKALAKDREKRYQNCDRVLADLQAVSRHHAISPVPIEAPHVTMAAPNTDRIDATAPDQSIWTAKTPQPAAPAVASTEDTVDFEPPPGTSTEDTVPILPPTWGGRLKAGIGAIAGAASRYAGSAAPVGARQSPSRKR